jgi:hypothetical protein
MWLHNVDNIRQKDIKNSKTNRDAYLGLDQTIQYLNPSGETVPLINKENPQTRHYLRLHLPPDAQD